MAIHCKCGSKTITVKKAAVKKHNPKAATVKPISPKQGDAAAKKGQSAASRRATKKATAAANKKATGCKCSGSK